MAKLSLDDINLLVSASDKYNKELDYGLNISEQLATAPGLMTYKEMASFIRGGTEEKWVTPFADKQQIVYTQPDKITDEQFVLGYMFDENHPERMALRQRLSEPLPLELEREASGEQPSMFQIFQQPFEDAAFRLLAAIPSGITRTAADIISIPESYTFINWEKVGKSLWEAMPERAMREIDRGYMRYKKGRKQRRDVSYQMGTFGDQLDMQSKLFAHWGQVAMESHNKDPKNRAFWNWAHNAEAIELQGGRTKKQLFQWGWDALSSPIMTTGVGLATFAATRNPVLAAKVGMYTGGLMEYSDEWNESYDYFITRGYSKENASSMANANALAYSAMAMPIENMKMKNDLHSKECILCLH